MAEIYADAFLAGLAPDPIMTVSQWADANRVLPESSAIPGRWKTARVPYMREPMDSLSAHSGVETTVIMAAAQVAKTEVLLNFLGYCIDQVPAIVLVVQPTLEMAKRFSRERLRSMLEECPVLRSSVRPSRSRDSGNTTLSKVFRGGVLNLAGANAAAGLRSTPARVVLMDEVDAYPIDVEGEGDPVELARARTRTFANARILLTSTPTIEGRSRIAAAYAETDQRKYFVPCPSCSHEQVLVWANLKYEDDDPATARYACEKCGDLIGEEHKAWMLANGKWKPTAESKSGARGYHVSALYTAPGLGLSWSACVAEWLKAREVGPERLRVFVNTVLGETWREKGEAPEWKRLYQRRETYPAGVVPRGAVLLTAGADVQGDRIEVEIVGWGPRHESWSVGYYVLPGDTATTAPFDALEELISRTWPRADGGELPIRLTAIDSGFRTQHVYEWTRDRPAGRVIATKGRDTLQQLVGAPKVVDIASTGKRVKRRGARVWEVGVSLAKAELYAWLKREPPLHPGDPFPHGFCHYPEYPESWFMGLTAEELVPVRLRTGAIRLEWHKLRERNEPLDCRVLARAAAYVVGVDRWTPEQWEEHGALPAVDSGGAKAQDGNAGAPRVVREAAEQPATQPAPRAKGQGGWNRWRTGRRLN